MAEIIDLNPVAVPKSDKWLWRMIWRRKHPACARFRYWFIAEFMTAMDPFNLRHAPGEERLYVWPGTRSEFDAMIRGAIEGARIPRDARGRWVRPGMCPNGT
jgi:hypothetical protein